MQQTKRTGGLTAIAIMNLSFGALGVIVALTAIVAASAQMSRTFVSDSETGLLFLGLFINICNLANSGLGIASGFGLLRVKPWGRLAALAYATVWILSTIVGHFLSIIVAKFKSLPPDQMQMEIVMLAASVALTLIYPIILITLLNRQTWKRQFANFQ